jgi:hypothetical protein
VRYQCEATTAEGFLQQLAVCYVGRGYWFYVAGFIPPEKDLPRVDGKLVSLYEADLPKATRARRKQAGTASVQYLRFQSFYVLIATQGRHRFFEDHGARIQDIRRKPIEFSGYSVSLRQGRPHVRINRDEFLSLKAYLMDLALYRSADCLGAELLRLPFEPYAPVRRQYLSLLRTINRTRRLAGLPPVEASCLRLRRRIYRPFEPLNQPLNQGASDADELLKNRNRVEGLSGSPLGRAGPGGRPVMNQGL